MIKAKSFTLCLTAALLIGAGTGFGQVSVDQANQKLQEKQKDRELSRSRPVTVTQGELDDMKAEIAKLNAQLQELRRQAAPPDTQPTAFKIPAKIGVGMTRNQLIRFVDVHKDKLEIASDTPSASVPTTAGQKAETITLRTKAPHDVVVGVHSNGAARKLDIASELRPDSIVTIVLVDDLVTSVAGEQLPQ
jgi:hypothetical protein